MKRNAFALAANCILVLAIVKRIHKYVVVWVANEKRRKESDELWVRTVWLRFPERIATKPFECSTVLQASQISEIHSTLFAIELNSIKNFRNLVNKILKINIFYASVFKLLKNETQYYYYYSSFNIRIP